MIVYFRNAICFLFLVTMHVSYATSEALPYDLKVLVSRAGANFQVQASYVVPVGECEAYAFLTDYEGAKNIPGIRESKVLGRSGNKVQVERVAVERILFFPISLRSVLEFSEVSEKRLEFTQIEGDAKMYKGSWVIEPDKNGTRFKHYANFELETSIPLFLIKYFLENSVQSRFEVMAERLSQLKSSQKSSCIKSLS